MINIQKIITAFTSELSVQILTVFAELAQQGAIYWTLQNEHFLAVVFFSSARALREVMFPFEVCKAFMSQISFIKSTGCTKDCKGFHLEEQFWHMSLILLGSHRRHVNVHLVCCSRFRIDKQVIFFCQRYQCTTLHLFEIKETASSLSHGTSAKLITK